MPIDDERATLVRLVQAHARSNDRSKTMKELRSAIGDEVQLARDNADGLHALADLVDDVVDLAQTLLLLRQANDALAALRRELADVWLPKDPPPRSRLVLRAGLGGPGTLGIGCRSRTAVAQGDG